MAITNRSLDVSQQKETFQCHIPLIPLSASLALGASLIPAMINGSSVMLFQVPYNCTLKSVITNSGGVSGSPQLAFNVERFIVGAGDTVMNNVASTLTLANFGTSGFQSVSLPAAGSSLLQLLAGDLVHCSLTGANTAVAELTVAMVVQAINDVKQIFGSSV